MTKNTDIKPDKPVSRTESSDKDHGPGPNGWSEYKLLVLKQLDSISAQVSETSHALAKLDKDQSNYLTLEKSGAEQNAVRSHLAHSTNTLGVIVERVDKIERDVGTASAAMDKRLEIMNEFRSALKDQGQTFFTRGEHELYMSAVAKDIRELRESRALLEGKASQSSTNLAMAIGFISLLISALSLMHSLFMK